MSNSIKHTQFESAKKILLNYRKLQKRLRRMLVETGAWFLAFLTFFAMIEIVLWIATLFSF